MLAGTDVLSGYAALSLLALAGPPHGTLAGSLQQGHVGLFCLLTVLVLVVPDGRLPKLDLADNGRDHRRVLAVLAYLGHQPR